jgi:hypothetical protein
MRRSIQSIVCALLFSGFLVSCGGGGGGSDSDEPAVTFTPSTATASYTFGTSVEIDLTAHVTDPDDFSGGGTLFIVVEDSAQVLTNQVDLDFVSDEEVLVTLHTSPTKPAGHYTGTFSVHLCRDAQCGSEYPGSPVSLPYDITVN